MLEPNSKKDYNLRAKMATWHEAIMSILINYYKKFKDDGYRVKEPEAVMKYTREYQKRSDTMLDYIEECIDTSNDRNDKLNITTIYRHFTQWYKDAYDMKSPSRNEFKNYLEKKYGKMSHNGWSGLKFRTTTTVIEIDAIPEL